MDKDNLYKLYKDLMQDYLLDGFEEQLYGAQKLSKRFIDGRVYPEEIIGAHISAFKETFTEINPAIQRSFDFLIEFMVAYGLAYREQEIIRRNQKQIELEMITAARLQQNLLPTRLPSVKGVELALVTVPAKIMSGDYYNFSTYDDGRFDVAIADIIGKGVPAALCMSMIKYAMELTKAKEIGPKEIMASLNQVVEKNIDVEMFITMFYMVYEPAGKRLTFASAGHEPALLYREKDKTFHNMAAEGLVLGLNYFSPYEEKEIILSEGDIIFVFTDGVTEAKNNNEFVGREGLIELLTEAIDKEDPLQGTLEGVYQKILESSNFELGDDITLFALKVV